MKVCKHPKVSETNKNTFFSGILYLIDSAGLSIGPDNQPVMNQGGARYTMSTFTIRLEPQHERDANEDTSNIKDYTARLIRWTRGMKRNDVTVC